MRLAQAPQWFDSLLGQSDWPCVSLFMPTMRGGPDIRQNPVRLRNLLALAEEQLRAAGVDRQAAQQLLQPARKLLDDPAFWRHNLDGLAVYLSPRVFQTVRTPYALPEHAILARRFLILPIIPWLEQAGRYYVLTLSQNRAQLHQGDEASLIPMEGFGLPVSLEQALAADELEESLQMHTRTGMHGPMSADRPAIYHGHGVGTDAAVQKKRVREYCRIVNNGVTRTLRNRDEPLVLAAVEWLVPVYQQVNSYGNLLDTPVLGNFDVMPTWKLHQRTWPMVEPVFTAHRQAALLLYHNARGTTRVIDDLEQVLTAAASGRVDTLLAAGHRDLWGMFDPGSQEIRLHAKPPAAAANRFAGACESHDSDEHLLNLAAVYTLQQGGQVHMVPDDLLADQQPAAAVLRY